MTDVQRGDGGRLWGQDTQVAGPPPITSKAMGGYYYYGHQRM